VLPTPAIKPEINFPHFGMDSAEFGDLDDRQDRWESAENVDVSTCFNRRLPSQFVSASLIDR
jgi:hypothetical protein